MSRRIALASAALWLFAGVPAPIHAVVVRPAPSEYDASDRRIEAQVKNALDHLPALGRTVHVVDVQDGVVFLGTESASLLGQFRAIEAATEVPGVREVRMRLTGTREPREDDLTRVVVADAPKPQPSGHVVRDDAASETELAHADPIRITPEMAAAAEQASAALAHGMKKVVRNVRDAWITAATEVALRISPAVHAQQVAVHTVRRVVTLSGTVPSRAAEDAVVRVASDVSGVRRVTDALVITPATINVVSG